MKKGDVLASVEVLKARRLLLADKNGVVERIEFDKTLCVPVFAIVAAPAASPIDATSEAASSDVVL